MNEIYLSNTGLPLVSSCDYLAASAPFFHADRITAFHIMIYVTEGCIYVTEDDMDYENHAGELLFLKSGIHHFGRREIKRGTSWHYAHFYLDEGLPASVPDSRSSDSSSVENGMSQPLQLLLPKQLTNLQNTELSRHIVAFTEYSHSNDSLHSWNIHVQFFQLLTEIAYHTQNDSQPASLSDNIAKYLTLHYDKPFSSAALEQTFYLSYKHMAAVFKKEKQLTMQQYHTQIRMNTACKLLRSTLLSVGEIGHRLGYTDILYFSRCFHVVVGMSPSDYRKQVPRY